MKKPSLEDKMMAAQIEKAHQQLVTPPAIMQVSPPPVKKIEAKKVKAKNIRMTIDMPESMHEALKYRIIRDKKTLKDFIIGLVEKELGEK